VTNQLCHCLRITALLALTLLGRLPAAAARDLVAVAPELAKVEYEDAHVRVVRLRIPEHASLPTHERPRRVVVSLTANDVQLSRADGTVSETHTEAGSVAWSEPAVRSVVNLGGALENIVVELKQADHPAEPVAIPPPVPPAGYLSDSRHNWALENQYVRVYDVRVPPGETTSFHRHAYDQVAIFVSGGMVSVQLEGQPWGQAKMMERGSIAFADNAAKPITHRLRNDGQGEYHVVLIQFLKENVR
jgi:quercetin dioxygenase-like cupin family protein